MSIRKSWAFMLSLVALSPALAPALRDANDRSVDDLVRRGNEAVTARSYAQAIKLFMSANARALRHFVEYRGAVDAEPEIRRVALAVLDIMRREAPALFGDYHVESVNGANAAYTEHKKV